MFMHLIHHKITPSSADSPFVLTVGGKGRGNVRQAASIDVQEVEMVEVGKWTDLYITLPG